MSVGMIVTDEMDQYNYGQGHPMKPERISMIFDLLFHYDLLSKFKIYKAKRC